MQGSNLENLSSQTESPTIVQTDVGAKDGQNKCPKCGATDISLNPSNGRLRCNYCRHEFDPVKAVGIDTDISKLKGQVLGSGAQNIVADANDIVTFKCSSCGAEVVIDTSSASQARCHWCRNTLSVNQQIPNGAIPDMLLPFKITKSDAEAKIQDFVKKRQFYAHPKFKAEFTSENIMGVYFPYMVVDMNAHALLVGEGEHTTRKYVRRNGDHTETYYDADVYAVEREFDVTIHGLTVESNKDRLNKNASDKTNNVINAIMPFDIENCVQYNANYLKGYTSEKRDVNVDALKGHVTSQATDIAKFAANDSLSQYDRGVAWAVQNVNVKGEQWKSAYLPVWLYSYQQVNGDKKILHYVAVNARTKETMGSVPIYMPKLLGVSFIIEILGIFAMLFIDFDYSFLFATIGFIYFFVILAKYRNFNARHKYETETKTNVSNMRKQDRFITKRKGLSNAKIRGANNTSVTGESLGNALINSFVDNSIVSSFIKDDSNESEGK